MVVARCEVRVASVYARVTRHAPAVETHALHAHLRCLNMKVKAGVLRQVGPGLRLLMYKQVKYSQECPSMLSIPLVTRLIQRYGQRYSSMPCCVRHTLGF
jgi:hypothetical protein